MNNYCSGFKILKKNQKRHIMDDMLSNHLQGWHLAKGQK